jgi:hypothetical protein
MKSLSALDLIRHFDELPDDAVVPLQVSRLMRGGVSEWTDRRNPKIKTIDLSAKRKGHRVGDIRAHNRGVKSA